MDRGPLGLIYTQQALYGEKLYVKTMLACLHHAAHPMIQTSTIDSGANTDWSELSAADICPDNCQQHLHLLKLQLVALY